MSKMAKPGLIFKFLSQLMVSRKYLTPPLSYKQRGNMHPP